MTKVEDELEFEKTVALWALRIAIAAFVLYFIFFVLVQRLPIGGPDAWGLFGDYFGGIINPVVGLVTVLLVVRTLKATRAEAKETRDEMSSQTRLLEDQARRYQIESELKEHQKRLDGVLAEWNQLANEVRPSLSDDVIGRGSRPPHTLNSLLRRPDMFDLIKQVKAKQEDFQNNARLEWMVVLEPEITLLAEMAEYCAEYEAASGSRALADFYRRRVFLAFITFKLMGVLPEFVLQWLGEDFEEKLRPKEN
jgi:uncharacterized membrane protein